MNPSQNLHYAFKAEEDDYMQPQYGIPDSNDYRVNGVIYELREENRKLKEQLTNLNQKVDILIDHLVPHISSEHVRTERHTPPTMGNVRFPLLTDEELKHFDSNMSPDLMDFYSKRMQTLLGFGPLSKTLKYVISESLIVKFNLSGVAGKMSLRTYKNFYAILTDATARMQPNEPAEKVMRKAILNIKNKKLKKDSRARKKLG
ncbi:hypothetical protein KR018_002853 [Drosophila ironensis]|nr:hypothetical protein KR018_002853 [Drosophila ironensis]